MMNIKNNIKKDEAKNWLHDELIPNLSFNLIIILSNDCRFTEVSKLLWMKRLMRK